MTEKEYIETSAKITLKIRLASLARWCSERAEGQHNTITTMSLLNRKVQDIEQSVLGSINAAVSTYPTYKANHGKEANDN